MRFILAGNEKIGYDCLNILLQEQQHVVAVITDKKSNKSKLENSRLKYLANQSGINLYEVDDINDTEFLKELEPLGAHILFNIAFLQLYKSPILAIPELGCINFHPGPLPKYGGSNGWVWAIINGESEYGVTFHYMKEKIDTGHIIGVRNFKLENDETGLSLLIKCYDHGVVLFRKTLRSILDGTVISVPQDLQNRTYYYNKVPFEGKIDTSWSAAKIYDFVRAMSFAPFHNPLSPAMINFDNSTLVVKKAKIMGNTLELSSKQGEVIDIGNEGVVMQTGNGLLLLTLSDRSMPLADTAKVCISKGITKGTILGSL